MMEAEKYYTTNEVAEILRLTPRSVCNLIKKGRIAAIRSGERRWIISDSDLSSYMTQNQQSSEA